MVFFDRNGLVGKIRIDIIGIGNSDGEGLGLDLLIALWIC